MIPIQFPANKDNASEKNVHSHYVSPLDTQNYSNLVDTSVDAVAKAQSDLATYQTAYNNLTKIYYDIQSKLDVLLQQFNNAHKSKLTSQTDSFAKSYNTLLGKAAIQTRNSEEWYDDSIGDSIQLLNDTLAAWKPVLDAGLVTDKNPFPLFMFPDGDYRFTLQGWFDAKPTFDAKLPQLKQAATDAATTANTNLNLAQQQSHVQEAQAQATVASTKKYGLILGIALIGIVVIGSGIFLYKKLRKKSAGAVTKVKALETVAN